MNDGVYFDQNGSEVIVIICSNKKERNIYDRNRFE